MSFFCQKSILLTDSITFADVPFVYDVVLVQCKKITKFGGVLNIQGAHAVFRLGKPSFKKENLFLYVIFNSSYTSLFLINTLMLANFSTIQYLNAC